MADRCSFIVYAAKLAAGYARASAINEWKLRSSHHQRGAKSDLARLNAGSSECGAPLGKHARNARAYQVILNALYRRAFINLEEI